ncbi:synaptic vesicle glycoprotein 2A-like [Trichoplusia ni]|uniref:Synaptic vesicle glycoprotein 2A-like n=1 Tax=Trichoplusia ni TaxID=7111 RepID=A0A7E5VFR5_TRINI|nr:synaptic vesicle glycoprotein 2A-like [Trichoplusia ni]XP_026727134.1 synaptic vesicle glycoprotein 2A-like [Trichoplusia ni]
MPDKSKYNSEGDAESAAKLNPTSEYSFEEAFEQTGHGKLNHLVLFTSGLIMLNVSMESVGMSYAITTAECELKLTNNHKGLVNAAAFIGIISTSFLWGYLGDRIGRRAVMLPAILLSAVFSIISSFSSSVWMLMGFRFLTGCLISASSATVYAYLGEMHAHSKRAAAIAWSSVFISLSFIILPGLAWLIIPGKWSFSLGYMQIAPWRAFVWLWCAPGLAAAAILLFLPESPRYLLASRGPDAALPVLAQMYAWNTGKKAEDFPVTKIASGSEEVKAGGFAGAVKNLGLMFRPPLLKCVFISHISMFAVFMVSSGLYVWVPDILNNILSNSGSQKITICQIIREKTLNASLATTEAQCEAEISVAVFPISMSMGAVFALTYLAIGFLINKVGRKTLYSGIMVICGLATIGAAFVPEGVSATVLLIVSLCSGCAASILAAIAVDVFPTSMRAMSMCVMYMVGRAGAALGSWLLGAALDLHCLEAFTAFGVFTAASTLLMLLWPDPTKVRRELEEKGFTF